MEEGIPENMADAAISSIPPEFSEEVRIFKLKAKKAVGKKDMVGYLSNRGFTFDSIYRIAGIET